MRSTSAPYTGAHEVSASVSKNHLNSFNLVVTIYLVLPQRKHTFGFSVEMIPNGIYFYRVIVHDSLATRKMTILKE